MDIKKIMVVGAGQMGSGIAQVAAVAGLTVVLNDIKDEFVQRGLGYIEKNLTRDVTKGRMEESKKTETLGRIVASTSLADASDCCLLYTSRCV